MGKLTIRLKAINYDDLEYMDWVVDLRNMRLIPNPEHRRGELADEFGTGD